MDILTKNGLCAILKQYPNMPVFVGARRPFPKEGFYDTETNIIYDLKEAKKQKIDTSKPNYKPCLIL